jgi:hypothetical protein
MRLSLRNTLGPRDSWAKEALEYKFTFNYQIRLSDILNSVEPIISFM